MALTKDKKNQVVDEVNSLLNDSKMTVIASYQGTPVKAMQSLRKNGKENNTTIKVVKNRLVKKAIESNDKFKSIDTSNFTGMLLYAFNSEDEVAPAQVIANFAKTQPTLEFVGAISSEGKLLSSEEVKSLAALPSKNALIAGIISTLNSPVLGVVNGLRGNIHGLLDAVALKAS